MENNIYIHCSQLSKVMSGHIGLTDKQKSDLEKLESRTKPMTDNMIVEYRRLVHKRDNPELGDTAKTHIRELVTRSMYKVPKDVKSKYFVIRWI